MNRRSRIGLFGYALAAVMLLALPAWAGPGAAKEDTRAEVARPAILVFAAASLTDVLEKLGADFGKSTGIGVKFAFAASSVLARQIEAGASADIFFSADLDWMDYLQSRKLIQAESRRDLLGNRLVLVAPAASTLNLKIAPQFELAAALGRGRLAAGDPDSVPAGRYARAALTTLGVWTSVEGRLVRAENVRAALAFVERGEVPLGIVYRSDALMDKGVRIVDTFPAESHPPITYPIALTVGAKSVAAQFADYLGKPAVSAVFVRYGFTPLH